MVHCAFPHFSTLMHLMPCKSFRAYRRSITLSLGGRRWSAELAVVGCRLSARRRPAYSCREVSPETSRFAIELRPAPSPVSQS